jgi:hypothetical protein
MTRWISLLLAFPRGRPRCWQPAVTTTDRLLTLAEVRSEPLDDATQRIYFAGLRQDRRTKLPALATNMGRQVLLQ